MAGGGFWEVDPATGLYVVTRPMTLRSRRCGHLPDGPVRWGGCTLVQDGDNSVLTVAKGYVWDGPSNFPDLEKTMRATLHHDALYEGMRREAIPGDSARWEACRKWADECFEDLLHEDGLGDLGEIMGWAVDRFGASAAMPLRWDFPGRTVTVRAGRSVTVGDLRIGPASVRNLRFRDVSGDQPAIRVTKIRPVRITRGKEKGHRQVRLEIEGVAPGRATARIEATADDYGSPVVGIPVEVTP